MLGDVHLVSPAGSHLDLGPGAIGHGGARPSAPDPLAGSGSRLIPVPAAQIVASVSHGLRAVGFLDARLGRIVGFARDREAVPLLEGPQAQPGALAQLAVLGAAGEA